MASTASSSSGADSPAAASSAARYLVFGGKTGWIGQKVLAMLVAKTAQAGGDGSVAEARAADARLEDVESVARELESFRPTHVLNCAGLTGRPNVDWCEDHKAEVVRVNVVGTLALLDACETRGVHCTNFATGCIYTYDDAHPLGGAPIPEEAAPNYRGSFYSLTKAMVDTLSWTYTRALTLRLRMPISDDLSPRNFVTKISGYARVIDVPNSVTVLHDLLPVALALAARGTTGVFNFTNPGTVSHNEVLALYRDVVDPTFWWENFSEAEQAKVLKAGRCNNHLDVSKLLAAVPDMHIPTAREGLAGVFARMRADMEAAGAYPPPPRKGPKPQPQAAAT